MNGAIAAFGVKWLSVCGLLCGLVAFPASASPQSTPPGDQVRPDAKPTTPAGVAPGSNVAAHLRDGSVVYGKLDRIDADSIVLIATMGRVAFPRSVVGELRAAGAAHTRGDGSTEYWFKNSNTTRLIFGPTGRMLAQGEGYFADHDIAVGSIAVGVTDRFMIGGGGLLVPSSQLWFVTPKVGIIQGENFNLAVGVLAGGWGSDGTAGVGYVVGTFGGTDNNLTVGVGNGFVGSTAARDQVIMLGGQTRATRRISFVTENYLTTANSDVLFSYGIRFLGEKFSTDVAFFNLSSDPVWPGIPFVGVSVKF
jgi:hypothetical protein